jgi:acetylornithine deacetylase/succinyl-diaminopimelate desuccinylase-like protein
MPGIADNALVKAAPMIERLASHRPEPTLIPEAEAFFRAVCDRVPSAEEALPLASSLGQAVAELIEPLLGPTIAPTMIRASELRNVIPALCELTIDCRLLPGQTFDDGERLVRELLSGFDFELRRLDSCGGTRSPANTPLWHAIAGFVSEIEPGARIAPICSAGFTDSHWLRECFGTVAYGFFPIAAMDGETASRLYHGADERIALSDLELGVRFLRHLAQSIG